MMRTNRIFFFCACLLFTAGVYAQVNKAASADFKKVSDVLNRRRYTYRLTYSLYDSYRSIKPLETQVMDIRMWDMMINIKNRHFQVIRNKDHYVYINSDDKVIMLNTVKNYNDELKQLNSFEKLLDIDTLLSEYAGIETIPAEGNNKGYRLRMPDDGEYKFIDVIFDKNSGVPEKIILYYAKGLEDVLGGNEEAETNKYLPRMEIALNNFVTTPKMNETQFSISPFIAKTGKKYTLKQEYAQYQFIDNTY